MEFVRVFVGACSRATLRHSTAVGLAAPILTIPSIERTSRADNGGVSFANATTVITLASCALFFFTIGSVSSAGDFFDDFKKGPLNQGLWCPCQIDMKDAPVTFSADQGESGDRIAHIIVKKTSIGGNLCKLGAPDYECGKPAAVLASGPGAAGEQDSRETLGPSFMDAVAKPAWQPAPEHKDPYCEEGECIQRQELRLTDQYVHDANKPYLYSIRFRMPKNVGDTKNSIRWVTAQWKQEPLSDKYKKEFGEDWGASPFLAQRYDNGVLHITVQDEHCRCMIASAPQKEELSWDNGTPKYCQSTRPEDTKGKACTPDLTAIYGDNPMLTSPAGKWTELTYRVQADRTGKAMIEIHEGKRFIVRVTGKIGYEPKSSKSPHTKFKIGHYRDYMPFVETMDIDWVRAKAE